MMCHNSSLRVPTILLCALLLTAAAGCSGTSETPPNLVLITVDTTRADHLGCYGSESAETPTIDRLAAEGALFEQAISVAPLTLPSHTSMMTGQYPPRHGVRLNGDFRMRGSETTLAEHLSSQGYSTAAVVSAYVLSADFGIDQGFEIFEEPQGELPSGPGAQILRSYEIVERDASESTEIALRLLAEELPEPFFLWLHYFDPHGEYTPPEPFASRFADAPYDGEIAFVDQQLGRVVDALRESGQLDRTLVALTADHGESLGEHGENTHGLFVYDATQHVPMLLRLPESIPAGTRSARLVSGVDLAPTVLDLMGLPQLVGIEGESFGAAARGLTMEPRVPVYAEAQLPLHSYGWSSIEMLRDDRRKLIRAPQLEFYDLENDPGETTNVAFSFLGDVGAWAERLEGLESAWPPPENEASSATGLDEAARAKLSALGYVSSGGATEREGRFNPRTYVQLHNMMLDVHSLVALEAFPQAEILLSKALEVDPGNPLALEMYGTLLCSTHRCEKGIESLERAAAASPRIYQAQRNLGNAQHLLGRLDAALATFRTALKLHPFSAEDQFAVGNILYAKREAGEALVAYDAAIRLGLDHAAVHAARGVTLAANDDLPAAERSLTLAVEREPRMADAWNQPRYRLRKAAALRRCARALPQGTRSATQPPGRVVQRCEDLPQNRGPRRVGTSGGATTHRVSRSPVGSFRGGAGSAGSR